MENKKLTRTKPSELFLRPSLFAFNGGDVEEEIQMLNAAVHGKQRINVGALEHGLTEAGEEAGVQREERKARLFNLHVAR